MGEANEAPRAKQIRAAGVASITGWAMDLYDLTIVLYVASTIGPLLFPSDHPTLQLTFVYASFAVTLVFRPLGASIFGAYADRSGRKRVMIAAVLGVGLTTALMGAVPTYAVAGLLAPMLFLVLRVIQGIFVGGVVASTHTLGTETVPARHRGLMSGVVSGGGAGAGAVVASLVYFVVSWLFPGEAFATYGWRVMFFTGLLTALFSFYVYRRTEESPLWKGARSQSTVRRSPVRELLSARYRTTFALNVAVTAGGATTYYLTLGFFPTFLEANVELAKTTAAVILIVANLGVIVGGALGGHLSDRFGRRAIFLGFGAPNIVALPALYLWLASMNADGVLPVAILTTIMAVAMMCASAPILIFLNERYPTEIRATGTAVSWNLGFALGGITPTVVTALSPTISDIPIRLAVGMAIASVVLVLGVLVVGETKHFGLGERTDERSDSEPARPIAGDVAGS